MKKKKVIIVMVLVLLIVAGVVLAAIFLRKGDVPGNMQRDNFYTQAQGMEGISAAYGITSIGTLEETFSISGQEAALEVEEVYVSSGEEVTKETKLMKFTSESVNALFEELEQAKKETSLAYRAGAIEFAQEKINLEYERDSALLAGEQAQQVYEETISGLAQSMEQAKEKLEDTEAQIADYEEKLASNYYYNQMQQAQAAYDENLAILKARMEEWGVSWNQVISGGGGGMGMMRSVSGGDMQSQYVTVLSQLYKVLESNLQTLESARADYENMEENGALELQTLQLSLPSLKKDYAQQQESYESRLLQAKLTRESSLATAAAAVKNYETGLEKAQSDYDKLLDAYEEACDNLEYFQERVATGYFYASGDGELLRFNVRAGQSISDGSRMYTMINPEMMTVAVSVAQESIASVKVGDGVIVVSSDNGMFEGVVESINPVSTGSGQSSVTYSVEVTMTGDYKALSGNETVTVYFGMKGEQ